jgi:FkbH-like protein
MTAQPRHDDTASRPGHRSGADPSAGPTGEDISTLHRAGRLSAEYPRVAGFVGSLSGPELIRAGQLLSRLDPDDVVRRHPGVRTVTVAVTGHATLAALIPALTAELARHGILARTHVTDFGSYVPQLADPGSGLYAVKADLTLCVLDPMVVFDEVPVPWGPADVQAVLAGKLELLAALVGTFGATGRGTLVLNTLPLPRDRVSQLVDHTSRAELGALWRDANAQLLRLTQHHPGLVVIDLDPLLAEGITVCDTQMSVYAKAHLSQELLAAYAREVGHLVRHLVGLTKKCLTLDLDGTVWGGVLGDEGADGIEVAGTYRGEAFRAFQRAAKQLAAQGVLLAAVSKNDPGPVSSVLREHPEMVLREPDFVRVTADWQPKHVSLQELAAALNIGTDSIVFVDDSAYECGLVRRELPDVTVIELDAEPAYHVARLLRDGWFDVRELTGEDRIRSTTYREELVRHDFLQHFNTLDGYLSELGIQVRLSPVTPAEVPRISQLTLRTNQFNLTTWRLQPTDLSTLLADPTRRVLSIRSADRFGDNGLVGAVFMRWDRHLVYLENFVLSCRVFARGIEQACLAAVLRHARASGACAVHATYRPTAKNHGVREFYPRYGFRAAGDNDTELVFQHDLVDIIDSPPHIQLADSLEGALP